MMGIKEKVKQRKLTKQQALAIVEKWKEKDLWNHKTLEKLENWIRGRK